MNDKELDQILRKSLRTEVSEEELEVWDRVPRMESEHTMRRHTIIKSTVAAAACLALVAGIGYGHFSDIGKSPAQQGTKMTKTTPQSVLNSLTVTVSAAEVKKNKASGGSTQGEEASGKAQPKIYATASTSYGSAWSGDESGKKASYWILAPISCTGDNIKSVTYTINKGYFSVAAKKDSKYLIASESLVSLWNFRIPKTRKQIPFMTRMNTHLLRSAAQKNRKKNSVSHLSGKAI